MQLKPLAALLVLALVLAGCAGGEADTQPTTTQPIETTVHVHEYAQEIVAPGCVDSGYTGYYCACGDSYTDSEVAPTGHSYTDTVVVPTWDEQGYTEHVCANCGETFRDSYVECEKYTVLPPSQSGEVMHFFDDAAFIGDSVALKLQHFQAEYGTFGNATFFTTVSYSVNHAVNDTMFLVYRGVEMTPEDALQACGAKKVFILLGMNDIALTGIDKAIENWGVMLGRIRAKNPDIQVYIQSGTPIFTGGERGGLNNVNMDAYNVRLKMFAEQNGCHYIDIATVMKDATGGLKAEYCADQYVHVNYAACDAWAVVLKKYVGE